MAVANLGANKTPAGLMRAGRCVDALSEVLLTYDEKLKPAHHSGHHTIASVSKDTNIMLHQLLEANIFAHVANRKHNCFQHMTKNILQSINKKNYTNG